MAKKKTEVVAALAGQADLGKIAGNDQAQIVAMVGKGAVLAAEENQRDLVNQLLGQAQAFSAASALLGTFGISKLAYVKENKLYRELKGMKLRTGSESLEGTWGEFCGLLGISVDKADLDISNLRTFGEEALEKMQSMGIGYRDLAQYRKLPSDERAALIEAAKSGDKDQLLDLAESIMVKHSKERADLEDAAAALTEEVTAFKRREKNYDAELERAQLKIKRLSETKKRLTELEPRTEDIRQECMALQLEAELPITSLHKLFEEVLNENETSDTPESRLRLEQIYVTANIVAASALDMLAKLGGLAASTPNGNDFPQRALGTHILTREEAQAWLLSRPMIENRHEAEKAQRQEERDAAKPKGPGRPKKNKADEE